MVEAVAGWPLWGQASLAAGAAFLWLSVLGAAIRLVDRGRERTDRDMQTATDAGRDIYQAGRDLNVGIPVDQTSLEPRAVLRRAVEEAELNLNRTGLSRVHPETDFADMAWKSTGYLEWPLDVQETLKAYRERVGIQKIEGPRHVGSFSGAYFADYVVPVTEAFIREATEFLDRSP